MYVTVNSRGYAYAYRSFRDETGKVRKDAKCLGWAVDKEKGIYRNKKGYSPLKVGNEDLRSSDRGYSFSVKSTKGETSDDRRV